MLLNMAILLPWGVEKSLARVREWEKGEIWDRKLYFFHLLYGFLSCVLCYAVLCTFSCYPQHEREKEESEISKNVFHTFMCTRRPYKYENGYSNVGQRRRWKLYVGWKQRWDSKVLAISFLTQSYEHFVGGILRLCIYTSSELKGVARIPHQHII